MASAHSGGAHASAPEPSAVAASAPAPAAPPPRQNPNQDISLLRPPHLRYVSCFPHVCGSRAGRAGAVARSRACAAEARGSCGSGHGGLRGQRRRRKSSPVCSRAFYFFCIFG
ncbi:unnamed protein product [Urochloa humidicola]